MIEDRRFFRSPAKGKSRISKEDTAGIACTGAAWHCDGEIAWGEKHIRLGRWLVVGSMKPIPNAQ
jgi:hypothetical protein